MREPRRTLLNKTLNAIINKNILSARIVFSRGLLYNFFMGCLIDLPKLLGVSEEDARKLKICVALSGGRDSVALLDMLCEEGHDVLAVNVEHGIRGEESVADSRFASELCASYGVPLFSFHVDAPSFSAQNGYTLEQGARILRYRIFDKLLDEGKCDFVALAHHLDDQVETVLMRILRGTGIKGLTGMQAVSGRYIRPLLGVTRAQIDAYVRERGLKYVDDSTNDDPAYTRNFLRGEIATLKTRFPALTDAVARLCANAREAEDYICSHVPEPEHREGEMYVKISDLRESAIAKRLIMKAAEGLGVTQDIEERHFSLILALKDAENGKHLELTHSLDVHRQGEYLVFAHREDESHEDEIPFGEGVFEKFGIRVEKSVGDDIPESLASSDGTLYLDADSVPSGAVIRHRREGDNIAKFGGGSKSLGDFLTDKKVPKRKRDSLAVVAVGKRVLAVAGVDISSSCRVTDSTTEVFKISVIK